MKKNIKPALFILLFLMILQSLSGQVRINVPDYISRKFISYCKSVPREEIFLHTDRDEYIAGEELWFTVYAFDRQTLTPSQESRLVYVEVVTPDNKPLIKERFAIDKGYGPGQIMLPDTLSSGLYTIRAYTGWMKNFLPDNCFTRDIRIYNAISSKPFRGALRKSRIVDTIPQSGKISVKINNHDPDSLEIRINADQQFINSGNETVCLFIETRGNINLARSEKLTGENTRITVSRSLLMPGINHITILDKYILPVSERFIYSPVQDEKKKIVIKSADSYNTRSKVSLEIENEEEKSALEGGNFSISVSPLTGNTASPEIDAYLLFGSEFGGLPREILKGRNINELTTDIADSLLNCLESNWIRWPAVLAYEELQFRYRHESEDHYLSGKLIKNDQQPAPSGEPVLLSIPGKTALFQYALTDYDGNFSFTLPIEEETKDLIIQPGNSAGNYKMIMETSFSDLIPARGDVKDNTGYTAPSYISDWSSNFQVAKIYGISSAGGFLKPLSSPEQVRRFYGKPELEIRMDDYVSLPLMEEVFFELLPRVILKNNKSVYDLYIVDPLRNRLYNYPPVMMVNGVIFKDPGVIGNMDPALVEKIDAIRELYVVGDYEFPGIVNIITRSTDYKNMTMPVNAVRIPYAVVQPVASFIAPDYSAETLKNSRIPDFRNTLYWNPSIKPGKDGKYMVEFWSSDFASDYEVKIEGVTGDGKIVSLKKTISVK
jgi:Large extracellular alpha-helical protein